MNPSGCRCRRASSARPGPGKRLCAGLLAAGSLLTAAALAVRAQDAPGLPAIPKGLKKVPVPADNPLTPAKIELGKQLYFDPRLSADSSVSCASCHDPKKGWSNGERFAKGVGGALGGRNSPTVLNTAYQKTQFWDGRAASLEQQALGPVQNPIEMKFTLPEMEKRLNGIAGYRQGFQSAFGTETITADLVAKAIASFERTVLSGDAPWDRFLAGDAKALSASAQRGWLLFKGKAHCTACHTGPNLTDDAFHNIGVGMDAKAPDVGREAVSKLAGDRGAFKTPTLRDIARSGPYMHDGSLATLEAVVEHYDKGGLPNNWLDEEIYPLKLTAAEQADLVTFMKEGLASSAYPDIAAPRLPE